MKPSSLKNRLVSLTVVLLLIGGWEVLARTLGSRQILPGPSDALGALVQITVDKGFAASLGFTILRGLAGFLLAFAAALAVGIPSGIHPTVEAAFKPVLIAMRSVPVVAIILLAIIWLDVEQVPVFIGFLTMFPILSVNLTQGIRETDPSLIQMAKVYKVRSSRILREIYWPSILPYLFSGLSTAIGFGWRSVIIGEVLSQPRYGIGSMMQDAQSYLLVSEVIAWTLIAILVSAIFELIIRTIQRSTIKWKA